MKVANKKIIRKLSYNNLKTAKTRNIIAIFAIALTTLLFTSLFTISLSINQSIQEANFRQVGGWSHGSFKYLTQEQYDEIKSDALIKDYGLRRFVGMAADVPFNKSHVEIGYSDATQAHWMYCDPIKGHLPAEGTNEAATDTHILALLGIEPVIGNSFTMAFDVDGTEVTKTFILSGWWEYDDVIKANHVLIPLTRAQKIYDQVGIGTGIGKDGLTASWNMDVMLGSTLHIEQDLYNILANHGYQSESRAAGENYIPIGVNWGYSGSQLADNIDPMVVVTLIGLLLLILFTGYLIIYNIFQITVSNDIKFYGLLKTIGTTGKQLKRIIYFQAFLLSMIGIPFGLLSGYLIGIKLTPVILSTLNVVKANTVSSSPLIFLGSAVFALITVIISCRRPGRIAAKVSPLEAIRYSDGTNYKKKMRGARHGASLSKMAFANLRRNNSKTIITVISLSLSLLLLNTTVTFTNGFDMDKYLTEVVADFIVADAHYFQVGNYWNKNYAIPDDVISDLENKSGIESGGRVYGQSSLAEEFVTEDYLRASQSQWNSKEALDYMVASKEKNESGLLSNRVQLYGMERFVLDKTKLIEGDLTKLYEPSGHYIAAVYGLDDYGNAMPSTNWASIGDTVTIRHIKAYEYFDPNTGEILDQNSIREGQDYRLRTTVFDDIDYEVVARIGIPHTLSYRYYGADEFVMNAQLFMEDTGTNDMMYYACDVDDENTDAMEAFLSNLTNNQNTQLGYESKFTYAAEFDSFRKMFLILGGVLSFIIGIVGILNFLNAMLTSILSRRHELAMLQSIGMTGKQLKLMLIWEGLYYTLGAVITSLVLIITVGPFLSNAFSSMFWFSTYQFTLVPIISVTPFFAILGIIVPLIVYRNITKRSIIERLREIE
ncbi:ABC transporter permease [Fusibacter bizertensis]|uniref:ABC transporter permease n=1 Tax=Fusibacter bizertensis TaxID=1488331 RepID=A0ABT6NCB8_9FIRM|nr:ABC transporter permease [Fusibacter bizertensis]MDH8678058.1 ABC transporter permease [Fusibacter bizertensis]